MSKVVEYVSGVCRNEPDARKAHLYALTAAGNYWPMCNHGWNRSSGQRFSILRGWGSPKGDCAVCAKRAALGLKPITRATPHKTRWL